MSILLTNLLAAKEPLPDELYPWDQNMIEIFNNTISCTIKHSAFQKKTQCITTR